MKSSKLFILLVALALLAACGGESESPAEPTVVQAFMADPEAVARGGALFAGTCAGYCHSRLPGMDSWRQRSGNFRHCNSRCTQYAHGWIRFKLSGR